jgi:REP element-mobilizing transposase RayT
MSHWRLFYHLVWATRNRVPLLVEAKTVQVLERSLETVCREHRLIIHAIGSMPDHVHLALSIPPSVPISVAVQQLKGDRVIFSTTQCSRQATRSSHGRQSMVCTRSASGHCPRLSRMFAINKFGMPNHDAGLIMKPPNDCSMADVASWRAMAPVNDVSGSLQGPDSVPEGLRGAQRGLQSSAPSTSLPLLLTGWRRIARVSF